MGGPVTEISERTKRYEFHLSGWAQFGLVFSGLLIVMIQVAAYGYEKEWAWLPSPLLGMTQVVLANGLKVATIVLDGAAKAALLSITITVILRIDIRKIVDRIINAPPILLEDDTVKLLAELNETRLKQQIDDLERQLNQAREDNRSLQGDFAQQNSDLASVFEKVIEQLRAIREQLGRRSS